MRKPSWKQRITWMLLGAVSFVGVLFLGGFIAFQLSFNFNDMFDDRRINEVDLAGWKKLEKGMIREQVARLLGEPGYTRFDSEKPYSEGDYSGIWKYNWDSFLLLGSDDPKAYIVRFDHGGTVTSWQEPTELGDSSR